MKTALATLTTLASLAVAIPVHAAGGHDAHGSAGESHHHRSAEAPMSEGTIRKVDPAAGKLTIAHGTLANLNMPAMTMAFRLGNAAMLDQLKVGDRIRFVAEQVDGALTISSLEPVR
jgi:Cu/Ag efflux protein CusF